MSVYVYYLVVYTIAQQNMVPVNDLPVQQMVQEQEHKYSTIELVLLLGTLSRKILV